jgi:hypothetical protein
LWLVHSSTLVDGSLQKADLQRSIARTGNRTVPAAYAAAQFTAAKDGTTTFKIENAKPMAVYIDGKPASNLTEPTADLKAGPHTIIVKLDATNLPDGMRIRCDEVNFATQ